MAIVRNASILFVCTMIGNAANYCFQFLMGRTLSIEDYGAMNALLSVSTAVTLPSSAVMMVIAKYASAYSAGANPEAISSLYGGSLKRVALFALLCSLAFLAASLPLKGFLRLESARPAALLSIGIFGAFMMTVNLGMLQGLQKFYHLGAGIGLGGVLRLVLGAALLFLGLRLEGAILATALPALLIFLLTLRPLSGFLSGGRGYRHERLLGYSVPVLAATTAFAFLSNIDLVMARHFLPARDAGLYASVAVLGKALLYLPSSFALAVFPMAAEADALNGDSFKLLDKALLCTGALCMAGVAAFALMPGAIMAALFGDRFAGASGYLKYYGAAMSLMAVLSVIISFNLARRKSAFVYALGAGCAGAVAAIAAFHAGIKGIIISFGAVLLGVTLVSLAQVYRERQSYYRVRNYGFGVLNDNE